MKVEKWAKNGEKGQNCYPLSPTSARALRNEPSETRARSLHARASQIAPIDGTLEGTTLVLAKIVSSSVKIDVVSAELHFGTQYGAVLPGQAP